MEKNFLKIEKVLTDFSISEKMLSKIDDLTGPFYDSMGCLLRGIEVAMK